MLLKFAQLSVRTRLIAACLPILAAVPAYAAEEASNGAVVGKVAAASDEGQQAIGKMKIPAGLKVELWAAEPLLANPVALCPDEKGRFYVVETFRFQHGVFDVRGHMDWYEDDLSSTSVADRVAMLKRKLGPNLKRQTTEQDDKLLLLEDTTGSGRADKSTVFAEGFNNPEDGVASSVIARKGNVYFADIPNLWMLKDTKGDGHADVRKSLSYGYGVRYAYLGHDLHGLRFGPDGKLYFSIGDRAANVSESVDGRKVSNTESGSVFRCNQDGTGLEIFATGLRNPQQLIFNDHGDLFTGDNNPDMGDPARWVYVVEGGDSGWRIGYQHAPHPRNGGPWMAESLWQTPDKLDAASQIPPVAHLGAGPSGVAYYPGTGLNDHYAKHFFMCDFRGGFTGSGIHTFVMNSKGAGFELAEHENFLWDTLATDICFGPAGGAYVSDWVQGWDTTGKGRIYHVFDDAGVHDPVAVEVKTLLAEGFEKRPVEELAKLLSHRDQRIRQEAQFELADRGEASVATLAEVATKSTDTLPRIHAIWALGQIAAKLPTAIDPVVSLLTDKDDEVRAQAAKVLGEAHASKAEPSLVKLLADPSKRVEFFAALAVSKVGTPADAKPVFEMLRTNDDKDGWLRHAGVMALTKVADTSVLAEASHDTAPAVRMGALLALRRLAKPEVASFLTDADPRLVREAARAINDAFIEPARPALAALIEHTGLADPVVIRVLNANYRLGEKANAEAIAKFASKDTSPANWRVEALRLLSEWAKPGGPDQVVNLWRPLPERDGKVARDAITPLLAGIIKTAPDAVKVAAVGLIDKLQIEDSSVAVEVVSNPALAPQLRRAALQVLASRNDPKLKDAVKLCLADKNIQLRSEAIRSLSKLPDGAAQLDSLMANASVPEKQAAYSGLAGISGDAADNTLLKSLDALAAGTLPPALRLDVLEASSHRTSPAIKAKLKEYEDARPKTDTLAAFRECLEGGDAEAGKKVFRERADVSCIRCHTVHNEGGIVGPKLDGVGARQPREYLLESIVYPNAKIAPGFESAVVKTNGGASFLGVVRKEDDQELVLINADNKEIHIKKADIKSRDRSLSPMPEGLTKTLTKRDLRNLVEFLAELKEASPSASATPAP